MLQLDFIIKYNKKDELFCFKSEKVFVVKIRWMYYVPVAKKSGKIK